jgi:sugar lactone lactonase YvrE
VAAPEPHEAVAAVACTSEQTQLGEGARWDARRDELLRVDILAGRLYQDRVDNNGALTLVRACELPTTVGAITPIDGDDGWMLAAGRGFVHLTSSGGTLLRLDANGRTDRTRRFGVRLEALTSTRPEFRSEA